MVRLWRYAGRRATSVRKRNDAESLLQKRNDSGTLPAVSDQPFQLKPEQVCAVSVINVQVNSLNAAAHECRQPHINQQGLAKMLGDIAVELEKRKMQWLVDSQQRIQVASSIPDKLSLVAP